MKQVYLGITFALLVIFDISQRAVAAPTVTTEFIKTDQFGYRNNDQKIAIISDPIVGFNAALSFSPGSIYQIRDWISDSIVFSGSPIEWNGGATHNQSGDKVWYFDFSSLIAPSSYYVFDIANNVGSYRFEINECVYENVLKAACRANFYQRCGIAKQIPYSDTGWADAICHTGVHQDLDCRLYNDTSITTSKDLSGGWHDAGDYNKYVNYAWHPVLSLLLAFEEKPTIWTDDYHIPESGNGIPDLLDDVKWELDWLLKMQNPDGSILSVVGTNHHQTASPPSADAGHHRYYGPATTQASFAAAGMFALASIQFSSLGLSPYATKLRDAAVKAWNWAVSNPGVTFHNNGINGSDTNYLAAGDQEGFWSGFTDYKQLVAAIYLFAATGHTLYQTHIDSKYNISPLLIKGVGATYDEAIVNDALLYYTKTVGASASIKKNILDAYLYSLQNGINNLPSYLNQTDAYRAFHCDYNWDTHQFESVYNWGSNVGKSFQGMMHLNMNQYNLDVVNAVNYQNAASGYLHWFHGTNPMSKVYLSNMTKYGAENSIKSFYHGWFIDGSALWDEVGSSIYGPATGFVPGGPNQNYFKYTCCASACYPKCSTVTHLFTEPAQKAFTEINDPSLATWTISENQIYNQAAYIRLLSNFVTIGCSKLSLIEKSKHEEKFTVFPIPSFQNVSVNTNGQKIIRILIYNTLGQLIGEKFTSSFTIEEYSSGVYFIIVTTNQTRQLLKMIKQ